jgi:hypothetical protein
VHREKMIFYNPSKLLICPQKNDSGVESWGIMLVHKKDDSMVALKQTLFMDLLRLLTPEEISELTTTSQSDTRISLTKIIRDRLNGVEYDFSTRNFEELGAKVLTHPKFSEEVVEEDISLEKEVVPTSPEEDLPNFLYLEKKRFERNQKNLKAQEIHKLYQQSSAIDISQEKSMREDVDKSSRSGILVNKKHY